MAGCLCARADDRTERHLGYVRKLYLTISAQMFISTAVSAAMFFTPAVNRFMATARTWGLIVLMVLVAVTIIFGLLMGSYSHDHRWNYVCFAVFTLALPCMIGVVCTYVKEGKKDTGVTIMIAVGVTALVFAALTLLTLCGAVWKTGSFTDDLPFLPPFLIGALVALILFILIKIVVSMTNILQLIWCFLGVLIFSGVVIWNARQTVIGYEKYINAACLMYFHFPIYHLLLLVDPADRFHTRVLEYV